jgi:hypothetical protein
LNLTHREKVLQTVRSQMNQIEIVDIPQLALRSLIKIKNMITFRIEKSEISIAYEAQAPFVDL